MLEERKIISLGIPDDIFDEVEDYSDDFDRVIEILDNYNLKDIDIDEHSNCRIDDLELIEEFDNE